MSKKRHSFRSRTSKAFAQRPQEGHREAGCDESRLSVGPSVKSRAFADDDAYPEATMEQNIKERRLFCQNWMVNSG